MHDLHSYLWPEKGKYGLRDYEKVSTPKMATTYLTFAASTVMAAALSFSDLISILLRVYLLRHMWNSQGSLMPS